MKKHLSIIALSIMMAVGLMPTYAFAQVLDTETIPVNANVAKYAKITVPWAGPLVFPPFSGAANQTIVDGTGTFIVETNTSLNLTFAFNIAHETDPTSTLFTYLMVFRQAPAAWLTTPDATFVSSPVTFLGAQPAKTTRTYMVTIRARTGAISAQAAGNYAGALTLTVSAH
jgi:hypothetical protein